MATLGQLQTSISERLLDPSNTAVSLSSITSAVNDSIGYWKFRRFYFNQATSTQTLTAQSASIPLPADFLIEVPNSGFILDYSNQHYVLVKYLPQVFDQNYLDNGFGRPEIYTRKQALYTCYPIPDINYSLTIYYLKEYSALVNTSDTSDFTVNATRLITLWTLANLYAELRQDDKMEAYYRAAANDEYSNLEMFTAKANPSGSFVISSFL